MGSTCYKSNNDCNIFRDESVPFDNPQHKVYTDNKTCTQQRLNNKYVEDVGFGNQHIVAMTRKDGLADAMDFAFGAHNSFTWSPDSLWLRISQGLATHIRLRSEELREKIAGFEGTKELKYIDDNFVRGHHNDWESFFSSMAYQIGENTNEKLRDLFTAPFSTTQNIHSACAHGLLMDACADYFAYVCGTRCGIPEFRFLGDPDDWEDIRERARCIPEYGKEMEDWYKALSPILDEFVNAANGRFNKTFWQSMYKKNNMSGGPYISGWVNTLYPYIQDHEQNDMWNMHVLTGGNPDALFGGGMTTDQIPSGLSSIPFKWEYLNQDLEMELVVGAFGVHQDPDNGSISPAYGWAIIDLTKAPENMEEIPAWMRR